jgi:hypothetical protein
MRTLLLVAMVVVLNVPGVHGAETTATYTGGAPTLPVCAPDCPAYILTDAAGVGGAVFAPTGVSPRWVNVSDDSGAPVRILACQDVNDDLTCDGSEPFTISGCGTTLDLSQSRVRFRGGLETRVTVFQMDAITLITPGPCTHAVTGGTITIST